MNKLTLIFLLTACLGISACETIEGAGRDIQKAGTAIQRAAD